MWNWRLFGSNLFYAVFSYSMVIGCFRLSTSSCVSFDNVHFSPGKHAFHQGVENHYRKVVKIKNGKGISEET